MKRITNFLILQLLTIVLLSNNMNAQQNCADELSQEQIDYMNNTRQDRKNIDDGFFEGGAIAIPITAHIIRQSSGVGGLHESKISTSIQQLNNAYQQVGFEFSLCDVRYINNTGYSNNVPRSLKTKSVEFDMAVPNLIAGTINIFYVPNSEGSWSSFPAYLNSNGKDWIVMKNAHATDGSTLAHEMGHYFNLYHTHEDALGAELVNRSNCETAGDELCDTHAEPNINSEGKDGIEDCVDATCSYICNDTDKNYDLYTPNPKNIMSYAPASCKNYFSPEQINRIQNSYIYDRDYLLEGCAQIIVNPCEASDKAALIALHNATDGPNWRNKWDLNTDHKDWRGVTVNSSGCVIKLQLYSNNLAGNIPIEIGELTNLESLNISQNRNLDGEIPSNIGSLINLNYLNLSNNNLSGNIPPEIGMLKKLTNLVLSGNNFTGIIPEEIGNLNQLLTLSLNNNSFTGRLPKTLNQLTNIEYLNFSTNNLSGCFETELKSLCGIADSKEINNGNNFDAWWSDFCLNGNGICTGGVSQSNLCDITKNKEALIAIYNATGGSNWTNTWDLNMDYRNWYGVSVNTEGCIVKLHLNNNNLTGSIPKEIGSLQNLASLSISNNNLLGNIPSEIGMLESLVDLLLENNKFTGIIPEEIGNLNQLEHLNLSGNLLIDKLPKSLSYLTNLIGLNIENNNLNGCYEPELKSLCSKFWQPTNDQFGSGNNFNASWGDFCSFDAGICENDNDNYILGDYNKNGIVNHFDALYLGVSYGKTGLACDATDLTVCPDWEDDINGINAKYIDGDRNGIINKADAQAIQDNYGATSNSNNSLNIELKDFSFRLELVEKIARKYTYQVYIENFDDKTAEIKGIAGCINFGSILVVRPRIRFFDSDFETAIILNNYNPITNNLDIAYTCADDLKLTPNLPIAELVIIINDNFDGGGTIKFDDFITINAKGELSEGIDSSYDVEEILLKLSAVKNGSSTLSQNYPNPFSTQSDINYFIPETAKAANLKVYTLTGQLLQTTAIEHTGAGTLLVSSKDVEPGLYIYTLEIDGAAIASKKMIVQE